MEENNKSWSDKITHTRSYERVNTFLKSAAVALIFAVFCFAFDRYDSIKQDRQLDESITKLGKIEKNLSTRSLGIFPGYIQQIRELFDNINKKDSIVIMEDVLYYGFKSKPKEFYEMNKKLFDHAMQGGSVKVAYYNFDERTDVPVSKNIFHNMIKEENISHDNRIKMKHDCDSLIETLNNLEERDKLRAIQKTEYELCEKYFDASKKADMKTFETKIKDYLKNDLVDFGGNETSQGAFMAKEMCKKIQQIKEKYLNKDIQTITFMDLEKMDREISKVIADVYTDSLINIKLVPMDDYLTMGCWMVQYDGGVGMKAVLAFPSKYSSDEIGFYSQDEAFSEYIKTMFDGIQNSR